MFGEFAGSDEVGIVPTLGSGAVGVMSTLGSVAQGMDCVGGSCFWWGVAETWNISDSCLIASICLSPIDARGEAGEGFRMAQHRSIAARIAASADESSGILP